MEPDWKKVADHLEARAEELNADVVRLTMVSDSSAQTLALSSALGAQLVIEALARALRAGIREG